MKKNSKQFLLVSVFLLLVASLVTIGIKKEDNSKNNEVNDGIIVEKINYDNYEGEKVDSEGNFLVPYDIAYPEQFDENSNYNKNVILVKANKKSENKVFTKLKGLGAVAFEEFMSGDKTSWYKATLQDQLDAKKLMNKVRSIDEVIVADYDYIYKTTEVANTESTSTETQVQLQEVSSNPEISKQWYLDYCQIQKSWQFLKEHNSVAGGKSSTVIAVIDTGIDYNHIDLKSSMWINTKEVPNNNIDDDNNGYIDDVYGANVITPSNEKSDPMDDNGHGTHVAGIIGAANNKEGIVGIAYNSKIMAVKAGQGSGLFNQSDIAEAILYAYDMGADIINMSFGGQTCSIAVQDALTTAYTRCTLVASSGNDGRPNEPSKMSPLLNYPACLPYVIGVQSVDEQGWESTFSNWDVNLFNKLEYEVFAPGEKIYSTLPNNQYGYLSGTSMSAPVVSGIAALLRSYYADRSIYSSKFIAGQIVATSDKEFKCCNPQKHVNSKGTHTGYKIVDGYLALTKVPEPDVNYYDYLMFDSRPISNKNNDNKIIDAGETIDLGLALKNRWGMSKNTVVTIDALSDMGIQDKYVTILNDTVDYGSVGTYSIKDLYTRKDMSNEIIGIKDPFKIKIADNCPNDYVIKLNVHINYKNGLEENTKTYESHGEVYLNVRNGVYLPSKIASDTTLTKDNFYIVDKSIFVPENVTLTIEPGTKIQFWATKKDAQATEEPIANIVVAGKLVTNGTEDELVKLFPSEDFNRYTVELSRYGNGIINLNYTQITNPYIDVDTLDHCILNQANEELNRNGYLVTVTNAEYCIMDRLRANHTDVDYMSFALRGSYYNCLFKDCAVLLNRTITRKCVFVGNHSPHSRYESNSTTTNYELNQAKVIVDRVRTDEKTGHTYIELKYNRDYGDSVFNYNIISAFNDKLCKLFDGHLATINDVNELIFYNEKCLTGIVGLDYNTKKWVDGTALDPSIFTRITDTHNLANRNVKVNYYYENGALDLSESTTVLVEIDNPVKAWTVEEAQTVINEYTKGALYVYNFDENVILNRINDPDINHWFILKSQLNNTHPNLYIGNAYFGTDNDELINKHVYDFDDDRSIQDIIIGNSKTYIPDDVFPFVTKAYFVNDQNEIINTINGGSAKCVVEFNTDMDTTVDLQVKFGSSEPYADYQIEGSYVSPRRWEGIYTFNTLIENGNQYLNITNGRKQADHFMILANVKQKFTFSIDTSASQALLMQGTPTREGIELNWFQDDFTTLFGYNIYRSNQEDGLYTKINDVVIPANQKTFLDRNIEPGEVYYYNFTVVKTDLTESKPSGKVSVRTLDTMAPDIYHVPVRTAYMNTNLNITATITDNLLVSEARLYYRTKGTSNWKNILMTNNNSKYSAYIISDELSTEGLEYYIVATDGVTETKRGDENNPYQVIVKMAVDNNSLGDVDGDGNITMRDALMLLQAANDLLNLTEDQFMRADINKDKVLSASEALRILHYVSGKITSIVG